MSPTITVRLSKQLALGLEEMAARAGVSRSTFIRDLLEKARTAGPRPSFMRLAGSVRGSRDLSSRKGFYTREGSRRHRAPGRSPVRDSVPGHPHAHPDDAAPG